MSFIKETNMNFDEFENMSSIIPFDNISVNMPEFDIYKDKVYACSQCGQVEGLIIYFPFEQSDITIYTDTLENEGFIEYEESQDEMVYCPNCKKVVKVVKFTHYEVIEEGQNFKVLLYNRYKGLNKPLAEAIMENDKINKVKFK